VAKSEQADVALIESMRERGAVGSGDPAAAIETALIALGLAALLFLLPHTVSGDALDRMQELTLLLGKGIVSSRKYSLIGPLFSAPLWLLGNAIHATTGALARFNWTLFVVALGVTYWLLRDRVERRLLRCFFLLLIAASMFPNHLEHYYGEVFTALLAGMGILLVACGYRRFGWVAVIVGVANTPAALVGMGLAVVRRVFECRALGPLLALAGAGVLIGAENWIRRGSPLHGGYEAGFTYPFLFGLLAILLSFGKGILFYAPGLLLPARAATMSLREGMKRELYSAYVMWMCFLAGLVLLYANWWAWYGGWYWGPRFFLFASIPACFTIAVRLRHPSPSLGGNLLTLAALALSGWVGIDGAVFDQRTLAPICQYNNYRQEYLCHYIPQYSALWRPFVAPESLSWQSWLFVAYCVLVVVYLALPVLRVVGRQTAEAAGSFRRSYLTLAAWRQA
jgi:hypothetical protein